MVFTTNFWNNHEKSKTIWNIKASSFTVFFMLVKIKLLNTNYPTALLINLRRVTIRSSFPGKDETIISNKLQDAIHFVLTLLKWWITFSLVQFCSTSSLPYFTTIFRFASTVIGLTAFPLIFWSILVWLHLHKFFGNCFWYDRKIIHYDLTGSYRITTLISYH